MQVRTSHIHVFHLVAEKDALILDTSYILSKSNVIHFSDWLYVENDWSELKFLSEKKRIEWKH